MTLTDVQVKIFLAIIALLAGWFGATVTQNGVTVQPAVLAAPTSTTVASTSTTVPLPVTSTTPPPGVHYLFDEEFNGTSLDTSKWNYDHIGAGGDAICPDPSQTTVSGGTLNLRIGPSTCGKFGNADFVDTNGHFSFTTGTLTVRACLPGDSAGIWDWPAIWTDGQSWPTNGESDLMEGMNGKAQVHYHSPTTGAGFTPPGNFIGCHNFGETVIPGKATYFYDGIAVGVLTDPTIGKYPHYILLGNQLGSCCQGKQVIPATMTVDWVHVN